MLDRHDDNSARFIESKLNARSLEWSRVIAVRSALRTLPYVGAVGSEEGLLTLVRANFVAWAGARGLASREAVIRAASSSYSYANASAAAAAASSAASAVAATDVASAAARATVSYQQKLWQAAYSDLDSLPVESSMDKVLELLILPLWIQSEIPDRFQVAKKIFEQRLKENKCGFNIWVDWYQKVIHCNGKVESLAFSDQITSKIANQPDVWWSRSVKIVNSDIADWMANLELIRVTENIAEKLVQRPAAASFGWVRGELTAEPLDPADFPKLAQDFLDEVRFKAVDLRDRLTTTNAAQRVRKSLNSVIAILPEQATDLRPGLLRSRARSLHADATACAGQLQYGELPVDATAMLLDLSGGLRDLEGCFPELRDIEREIVALNLKTADVPAVQRHLEEINKVVSESAVVADNTKTVMAAGTETMTAEATPDITEVRTAEQALTTRNLVNAAVQGSIQQILSRVPDTTGRVYEETEKAGRNLIRPVASVGASLLVGSLVGPVAGLAVFALAEYDRLPGIINFIKEARKTLGLEDSDGK